MSSGGGGGGGVGNTLAMENERARMEREEREIARGNDQNLLGQRMLEFYQNLDRENASAPDRFRQTLTNRGITDEGDLSVIIGRALDSANRAPNRNFVSPQDVDTNVGRYFGDSVIDDALQRVTSERRDNFGRQVQNEFGTPRVQQAFSYDQVDPILQSILGSQRTDAQLMLERARARGNLDDTGFTRGMGRLDELGTAGNAEARNLGNAVIDRYRDTLSGIGDRASGEAARYNVGTQFDLNPFREEWENTTNRLGSSLEGDVRSALGGQNFFDIGDIITQAGVRQGAQNPAPAQLDALAQRGQIRNAERGVGAGGTF